MTRPLNISLFLAEENRNPKPVWEIRAQSVVVIFLPSAFFAVGKMSREQASNQSRPESLEEEVLKLLQKCPLSKAELSNNLGHKHISGGLKKTLYSLLKQGRIAYTIPDKPNSRLQKYKVVNKTAFPE
ncbi:MAG: hypothetical protein HY860_00935 [Chlamydiales bacterium]|nr:hypothetical protein [Chlamydiales bacterium]